MVGRVTALIIKNYACCATMRDLSKAESLEKEVKKQGGSIDIHYCDVTKQMSRYFSRDYQSYI